jgi:hypothetical protein
MAGLCARPGDHAVTGRGKRGQSVMVWTHVDGVLNNQPHLCCGCYGFGPRGVSKCDERPAATLFPIALLNDVEPIGEPAVCAGRIYLLQFVNFPHGDAPCSFNLSSTIRRHAARSPGDHAVALRPPWHHRVIRVRPVTIENLTYAALAERLKISPEAARALVKRMRLPRHRLNDRKTRQERGHRVRITRHRSPRSAR